jgi:hypothetical protein
VSLPDTDTPAGPLPGTGQNRTGSRAVAYFARFDDGEVLRWAFRGLVIGTIGVLGLDLRDLAQQNGWAVAGVSAPSETLLPIIPPAVETDTAAPAGRPRPDVTADDETLRRQMRFELKPGGVLAAEGSIDPGAAGRLIEELAARGEYVKTLSLNSPGGALEDAMTMGRAIREKGIATEVADGALCASSCPLVMAGGASRRAGDDAAIGIHQFYAAENNRALAPAQAMSDAQVTTARINRYLKEMGVDPALWLHALDTPPSELYYLTPEELAEFDLVTAGDKVARK